MANHPSSSDINSLFDQLDSDEGSEKHDVIQKLQAIRLWQLMQQEELKKQQQTQLALLKSQQTNATISTTDVDDDEILAVPISDLQPTNLETILEQPSITENLLSENEEDNEEELVLMMQEPIDLRGENIDHRDQLNVDDELDEEDTNEYGIADENNSDFESNDVHEDEHDAKEVADDEDSDGNYDDDDLKDENALDELYCNIESSFEKASKLEFDDVPVKSGKTFEELLEEQLSKEKIKTPPNKEVVASTPKRTFLRKGQGISRFNGPPKKPKVKKKTQLKEKSDESASFPVIIKTNQRSLKTFQDMEEQEQPQTVDFNEKFSLDSPQTLHESIELKENEETTVFQKPRVRKTARLIRREPMKQLSLKPEFTKPSFDAFSLNEAYPDKNESAWSDVDDSALVLDTTEGHIDLDTTSNETFEQMEQFCNEQFANVSSVKTLESDDSVIMKKIEPLPPNKLMLSLFPSLRSVDKKTNIAAQSKATAKKAGRKTPENAELKSAETIREDEIDEESDKDQPKLLKNRLEEMEKEIKKFQDETSKLSSVRKEEEQQLHRLKQEFEEFQRQKEEELKRLEDFKKTETKKLKKERKLFDEHMTSIKSIPNKQDREYIHELEMRITELQSESKVKEQRLTAVNNRLRSQLDSATKENEKLNEKVKNLEEKIKKMDNEKHLRKNKKSQVVWKAINDIVDSIPNDENVNVDEYIQSHAVASKAQGTKRQLQNKPVRNPLVDRNENRLDCEVTMHDGKVERRMKDGTFEISFQNGTQKLVSVDGKSQIKFANGDVKTTFPDGTVKYHYISSGTRHTTHPNGMQVIEFSNQQVERHFPDGSKHISFTDGSSKMMKLDGTEETVYPDGTVMVLTSSGEKTIEYSNGQREVHTVEYKRREYPDGTSKTVFADGRQETKYSSGRLRIKDANGTLIVDKMVAT